MLYASLCGISLLVKPLVKREKGRRRSLKPQIASKQNINCKDYQLHIVSSRESTDYPLSRWSDISV